MKKEFIKYFKKLTNLDLSKKQQRIIFSKRKKILVLAAAGSGKTLTIKAKILYLIKFLNVKEEEILCISFTNEAVNSLKKNINNQNINITTFHKLALQIIGDRVKVLEDGMLYHVINESFNNNSLLGLFSLTKNEVVSIIESFIKKFKSMNYNIDYFSKIINKASNKDKIFIKEIMKAYICYETYLRQNELYDFDDMINFAIKKVKTSSIKYKYIIIDEYQDISYTKYVLINEIRKKSNSFVFFVGDDFQSIYGFAGSNINLILNIKKYFFLIKIFKLNITYRNSNELAKISESFITKNVNQIRKKVYSTKKINNPIVVIYYNDLFLSMNKIIKTDNINNLLVLSRNNKELEYIKFDNINCKKMTVHKSKGLEEDFVFIINVSDSANGFPNKFRDHDILKYINKNKRKYDEERRLFYVALTRCKKKVYIFTPCNNSSIFIKELIKYKNVIIVKD